MARRSLPLRRVEPRSGVDDAGIKPGERVGAVRGAPAIAAPARAV